MGSSPALAAALSYLLQPQRLILILFVAAGAFVHFRGRVRLKFGRQILDHSTVTAPYNALVYLRSRTPNRPFLDPDALPELRAVTANWEVFREEGLRLLQEERITVATGDNDIGFHTFFRRGWKRFYLKWYDDPLPSARVRCPRSAAILETIPSVHGAMFALLPPGAKLGRHRDPFAGSLRYHLGLKTPNNDSCWIEVDGVRRSWRDGQALLFDETYVHEAFNGADSARLILFCDVERPLRGLMAPVNRWVIRHVMRATATQNEAGERVGALNRAFERISRAIRAGKALKARSRIVYYGVKHGLTGLLLLLFVWP